MSEASYLGVDEFAASAGFSRQAASKALARAAAGHPWRGHHLEVRQVHGRGGKHGLRYQVSLTSLSEALGDDLSELMELPCGEGAIPLPAANQGAVVGERWAIIKDALDYPPGAKRAAAVKAAATASRKGERTLRKWIADYEKHGLHGLARRQPVNAGQARIHVSRAFDRAFRAAGHDEATLAEIGDHMEGRIKAIWASRAEAGGATNVQLFAEHELWKACRTRGIEVPEAALRLSRRHVERFAYFRQVNLWRNNRKAFEDGKPRIQRDWTALAPMARIVGDVKHLDVIVTRPDGSTAWPKIVGFQDSGTGRVFFYPLLLPSRDGVRQEHVIEAFIAMVSDPEWGFPSGLYLDNGTEFKCFERLRPALALVNKEAGREIIYAKPYNASAKSVENAFKRLDTYLFSCLPGYAGGERMRKKTQTVGKPPTPWPGTWESFCHTISVMLVAFNDRPYRRRDGKASATERFRAKVTEGWRPTLIDPRLLDAGFCTRETRDVDRGVIKIGGERIHNEETHALPHGMTVAIALPWRRGAAPLFQRLDGTWSQLTMDAPYPGEWVEGAQDAGRRQQRFVKGVKARAKEAGEFDPVAATLEQAGRHRPVELPGRPNRLGASSELIALSEGRANGEAASAGRLDEAARLKRREDAETARLEALAAKSEEMRRAG
ncbi:MAG: hypothetical protein ACOYM5_03110 [Caulobacter sp.]